MRTRGRPSKVTGERRYPNGLRELRRRAGLPQRLVAAAAGISIAYYGALERGDKRINADTAERLRWPLRCAVGDLLAGAHGVSVAVEIAVAAAEAHARPASFDLPEPHDRLRPGRLDDAENCFAAEVYDDSADLDFAPGTILVVRGTAHLRVPLRAGDRIVTRFYLDALEPAAARPTHEILCGILDRNIVGDLVLITRSRNRRLPRHVLIQTAAPGPTDRAIEVAPRDATIDYRPRPEDPGAILGLVVYAMGPI